MPSPIDLGARPGGPPIADGSVVESEEARLVVRAVSDSAVWRTDINRPHRHRRRSVQVTEPWRSCRISGEKFLEQIETGKNNVGH